MPDEGSTEAPYSGPAGEPLDQHAGRDPGDTGRILVAVSAAGEPAGPGGESLHRASLVHRDSDRLLRGTGVDSDWPLLRETPDRVRNRHASGPQVSFSPGRRLLCRHDAGKRGDRQPIKLSRRGAHGYQPILRTELSCDEARVYSAS